VLLKIAKDYIPLGNNVKIKYITDRPGHDQRYALNSNKIKNKLNWSPQIKFDNGLKETFLWYLNNKRYYSSIAKRDIVKRLGLKK
jgi:dTDP-glucose 4,6-dehydratase